MTARITAARLAEIIQFNAMDMGTIQPGSHVEVIRDLLHELRETQAEVERLKEALRFYATEMKHPLGNKARAALHAEEESNGG